MGRPKGLRKINGKWVMTTPTPDVMPKVRSLHKELTEGVEAMAESRKAKAQEYYLPVITKESKNVPTELYQRNDTVSVHNGIEWEPGVVLGYLKGKVVVQMLQDGNPRVWAAEDLVRPHPFKGEE